MNKQEALHFLVEATKTYETPFFGEHFKEVTCQIVNDSYIEIRLGLLEREVETMIFKGDDDNKFRELITFIEEEREGII